MTLLGKPSELPTRADGGDVERPFRGRCSASLRETPIASPSPDPHSNTSVSVHEGAARDRARVSDRPDELAEKAGMNVFGVAKIEQGLREPGWATVLKLAGVLGVECTAFCKGTGEKKRALKRRLK